MDLMGFADEEVAALQGDSSEEDSAMEAEVHHFDEDGENEEGNRQEMADYELSPLSDD